MIWLLVNKYDEHDGHIGYKKQYNHPGRIYQIVKSGKSPLSEDFEEEGMGKKLEEQSDIITNKQNTV